MKQIWPLLSLVLIVAPVTLPSVAAAEVPALRGGLDEAVMILACNKKDRDYSGSNRQRGNDDRRNDRGDDRQDNGRPSRDRPANAQNFDRGNGRQFQNRDDRINRAMAVAGQRGIDRPEVVEKIALRRLAEPDDISGVVEFLASDLAAYVTGQCISVCGGMALQPA